MANTAAAKPNPRPLIRLGLVLMSHSTLVSVVSYVAGILALFLLPYLAKNTYVDENALMPGSAIPMFSGDYVSEANRFLNQISRSSSSLGLDIPTLIGEHISALGGEVNYQKFRPQLKKYHPLHFFASPDPGVVQDNFSCSSFATNTVGIVRAPRGDGKEAIVLVTPYNSSKISAGEVLSLGIGYSIFSLLSRVTWLAKDFIWLASDTQHGEYAAVDAWLKEYHTPLFGGLGKLGQETCQEISSVTETKTSDTFPRAGTMAAALVVKVAESSSELDKDALSIYAEASNGQMPNLDLINIVNYLAIHGQGLRVRVEKVQHFLNSWWLKGLGELFESFGKVARSLNPQWKFDMPAAEYVEAFATLISSLYNQALGVPTGPHGAFRDYQVDAITMEISRQLPTSYRNPQTEFLIRSGRLIEGVIRCINNLLEKFHHSYFLYLLTSPNKFISVSVYMIAFGLLVAPLPVVAAALFSSASKEDTTLASNKLGSWRWIATAKTVLIVHLWGVFMTFLPYFNSHIPESTPITSLTIWIVSSISSLLFLTSLGSTHPHPKNAESQRKEYTYLKSVTIASAFIGLCLMSIINFATAQIGAMLLVPMSLLASPLRTRSQGVITVLQGASNLIFAFLGCPVLAFYVIKGALQGFGSVSIGEFWTWMVALWEWSSATYVYMCMVHLPCWVLCVIILLKRC